MADKLRTGIDGLDSLLNGGIPEGDQVVVAGGPGAGKTLLSFEFAYRGAKAGITSVFFALEEEPERVVENAKEAFKNFKDIDDLIASKKLIVEGEDLAAILHSPTAPGGSSQYEFGKIVSDIESIIVNNDAKRVVVDSLSVLKLLISDPHTYRRSLLALSTNLRRLGTTSLLTAEMFTPERSKLKFQVEFFVFDGILIMYARGEETKRMLGMEVIKMRGGKHSFVTTPYEITPDGIDIVSVEDLEL